MNRFSNEFFELSNDMLCIANFEGYFIRLNQAWEKSLGWSLEELMAQPFVSFVHPEDREATVAESKSLTEGHPTTSFENRYRCKNGEYKTLLWKSTSDFSQKLLFAVARDITEIKSKELSLIEDNKRFQQILNAIDDFILLKDPQSRLLWANKSFRDFYGFAPDEDTRVMTDRPDNDPALTAKYRRDDRFVIETGKRLVIPWEYCTRFDNKLRKLRVVKAPIFDDEGKVIMSVGVSKDITDELEREKLIHEQQVKMIHSARLSSLGEMAAGIAHEINNPLTIIDAILFQTSARIERDQFQLSELESVFGRITKSLDRIAKIVRSLRFFSRNSENDPFVVATLDSIFQDTSELCREKFKMAQVPLRLNAPPEMVALCRPTEIGQVLLNLVSNSFDAVHGTKNPWVSLDACQKDSKLIISVTDSGHGIPAEIQHAMMNPFFTTKEVGHGTGLGLSIALGIIKSHGGELIYQEREGHTSFAFDLIAQTP